MNMINMISILTNEGMHPLALTHKLLLSVYV